MPYASMKQARYMNAKKPEVAKEFNRSTSPEDWKRLQGMMSDAQAKDKVVDGKEDIEKFVQGDVLDKIMGDMDEYEFDKKLKPLVISIELPESGAMQAGTAEDGQGMAQEEMGEMEQGEAQGFDDLDERFNKLIRSKKVG